MSLRHLILKVLYSSPVTLTVHEICCAVNRKPIEYCQNVDGKGGHCIWWYRRGDGYTNRYHLVKPDCTYTALNVIKVVQELYKDGLVEKQRVKLRDPLSRYKYDYFTLVYIRKEQLRRRLELEKKIKTILDYLTGPQHCK